MANENTIDPRDRDNDKKSSSRLRSNVEHDSESKHIIEKDRETQTQSGFTEPGSPRTGELDITSGTDPLAAVVAGKTTP